MKRREFIKRGALFVPTIFIPRLIRAQSVLTADGLAAFIPAPATGGGGGGTTGTPFVTGITPATPLGFSIPLGMLITVGASDITVTALGAYRGTGNTGTRSVQIRPIGCTVDVAVTVDLSTVSEGAMAYTTASYTMSAATSYYIFRVEDGSQNSLDISNYTHTAVAVATNAAYFSGSCTSAGTVNQQYGGVDFKYA